MPGTVCLAFDFDAMSVWFGFPDPTPAMLARGEYGARRTPGRREPESFHEEPPASAPG